MTLRYAPSANAGRCPFCRSTRTETSPHGVCVCLDCGRSW